MACRRLAPTTRLSVPLLNSDGATRLASRQKGLFRDSAIRFDYHTSFHSEFMLFDLGLFRCNGRWLGVLLEQNWHQRPRRRNESQRSPCTTVFIHPNNLSGHHQRRKRHPIPRIRQCWRLKEIETSRKLLREIQPLCDLQGRRWRKHRCRRD